MSAVPQFREETTFFPCPGCGRDDGAHPPMCQIAVRLTAAHAARHGGATWRAGLRVVAAYYVGLFGCRWVHVARHYRAAAADDPPGPGDEGEPLAFAPAVGLFRPD